MAKNYATFDLDDFVQDRFFRRWITAPTPESVQFWAQWLHEHPNKKTLIEQARHLVLALNSMDHAPIDKAEVQAQIQTILDRADAGGRRRYGWLMPTIGWVAAASVCLAAGAGWWLLRRPATAPVATVAASPVVVQRNTTDRPRLINLPDGSTVLLAKNSMVRYARTFAPQERSVVLTGNAFFEVQKNPARPFVVYADKVVARVLGTSFIIRQDDHQTTVAVRTGRVQVYRPARKGPLTPTDQPTAVLTPNQQITYALAPTRSPASASAPVADAPDEAIGAVTTPFPQTQFTFRNTPVADVFDRLETAYTLRIDFDRTALRQCTITAVLTDEPLGTKLDLICKSLGLSYVLHGDVATVTGAGCRVD